VVEDWAAPVAASVVILIELIEVLVRSSQATQLLIMIAAIVTSGRALTMVMLNEQNPHLYWQAETFGSLLDVAGVPLASLWLARSYTSRPKPLIWAAVEWVCVLPWLFASGFLQMWFGWIWI